MAEPNQNGDRTAGSARPAIANGRPSMRGTMFVPERVVLEEQRAALSALGGRGRRPRGVPAALPLSIGDRSRLVALGIRVLTQAVITTESECRRIVGAAEVHAAAIVRDARDDVDRLISWLDVGAIDLAAPAPKPIKAPERQSVGIPPEAAPTVDPVEEDEIGREFFASFHTPGEDRWGFMDDDALVRVGPAILRRVLRRLSVARS